MIETLKDIYNDIYQNQEKVVELKKAFDTDDINHLTDDICSICENYEYVQELISNILISNINNMNCYYYDYHLEETVKCKTIIKYAIKSIENWIECLNYEYNELKVNKMKETLLILNNEINDFIEILEDMSSDIQTIENLSRRFREDIAKFNIDSYENKMLDSLLGYKSIEVVLSLLYSSNIEHQVECALMKIREKKLAITQNDKIIGYFQLSNEFGISDDFINEFNEVMNDY